MSTVGVTWFDSEAVRRALAGYVAALVRQHPEVDEVILFGSVAKGTAVPGSDVDLLLVLSAADRPFLDRIRQFLPTDFPVGVDVFPYTRDEIERMRAESNRFVAAAICEGVTLFRRGAWPFPPRSRSGADDPYAVSNWKTRSMSGAARELRSRISTPTT